MKKNNINGGWKWNKFGCHRQILNDDEANDKKKENKYNGVNVPICEELHCE